MKHVDLFQSSDLLDICTIGKVILSLSKLSQTSQALKAKFIPFIIDEKTTRDYVNISNNNNDYDAEDDYLDDSSQSDYYAYAPISKSTQDEEAVYGKLIDFIKPPASPVAKPKPKSHRELCINELLTTEENYVSSLLMLRTTFMAQLTSVLPAVEFSVIFKHIEQLYTVHKAFCEDLKKAAAREVELTLPDCFIMNKEKFLIYGEYCSNLLKAQDRLDILCKHNARIQQKVTECELAANEGRFRLRDLLTVPMQRVLKYHLLLNELIKNTENEDPERRSLEWALKEMQDMSFFVNEVKRDNETLNAIAMLEKSISNLQKFMPAGALQKEYGRMLMDGEIKIKIDRTLSRHVFLFNRIILICRASQTSDCFDCERVLLLQNCTLDETQLKDRNVGCGFTMREHTGAKDSIVFGTKKEEMRTRWIDAVKLALNSINPPFAHYGKHDFVHTTFETTTICDVCRKLLRGIFFQGYRCRNSQMSVHMECLEKAKDMDGPPTNPTKLPPRRQTTFSEPKSIRKVQAVSGYSGEPPPPSSRPALCFSRGAEIELLSDDARWCEGRTRGQEGVFPRNCIKAIPRKESYEEASPMPPVPRRSVSDLPSLNGLSLNGAGPTARVSEYLNELETQHWYAGDTSRVDAEEFLQRKPEATFLVRASMKSTGEMDYKLSLKHNDRVLHVIINATPDKKFYLGKAETFGTVIELVEYYRTKTLGRIFKEIQTTLQIPYKQAQDAVSCRDTDNLGICVAVHDYAATAPNQLSLKQGDRIAIINKTGESQGWWKGRIGSKVGYFPYAYVSSEDGATDQLMY